VIGCEITVDVSRTVDCLRDAVDREVRKAEREARRAAEGELGKLESQLQAAQRQVANAERDAKLGVARAEAAARAQLRNVEAQLAAAQRQAAELRQQLTNSAFTAQLVWQRALLAEIKKQEALFRCLEAGNVDVVKLLQEFSANPGNFAQARTQEVLRTVTSAIPAALATELDSLGRGQAASAADRTVLIRRGTDTLVRVAEQVPGGRCLLQTIPPQLRAQIEATIGGTLNEAERQARGLVNDRILPAVRAGLATQAFRSGSEAIEALAKAVVAGSTGAALEQARQRAEAALRGTIDYDQLYASLGVELPRAIGHKYIDSERVGHGGFLLNQGFSLLQLSGGTTQNVTEALCGLIPEVGGAVCAYVLQIVVTVWNGVVVPQLQREASELVHVAMDTSMDRVRGELSRGIKLAEVRSRLGPADAVIAAIPSEALLAAWANGFIDHDIKSIDRFTGSVLSLTSAAAPRR
jgi:hypothetical protein